MDDDGNDTDDIQFNFKSVASYKDQKTGKVVKRSLEFRNAAKKPFKPAAIFGGSVLRVAYTMDPYYSDALKTVGVSLRINAIQVLELANSTGGDYGFEEEDGYESYEDSTGSQESGEEEEEYEECSEEEESAEENGDY